MNEKLHRVLTRGACLSTIVAAACLATNVVGQSNAVLTRPQLEALIAESSKVLKDLQAARDQSVPKASQDLQDALGHTYKHDLQENVLLPDVRTRLTQQIETATKDLHAGDLPGAQLTLASVRADLAKEIERYKAVASYWSEGAARWQPRFKPSNELLQSHGVEPVASAQEAAALETSLHQQIEARDFALVMRDTWPKYQEVTKRAVPDGLAQVLAAIDSGALKEVAYATPARKCSAAKETSKSNVPTFNVRSFPPAKDYYPPKKAQRVVSADPLVFVIVDPSGCAERAVLVASSGSAELDDAATRWMADGAYFPAESGGQPVRSGAAYRVDFKVTGSAKPFGMGLSR